MTRHTTLLLLLSFLIGCDAAAPAPDRIGDDDPITAVIMPGGPATMAGDPLASLYDDDPHLEVRINHDAASLTDEVLPELASDQGLDSMSLSDATLASGTAPSWVAALMACHSASALWKLNMNDAVLHASLTPGDANARFDSGHRVLTDLDLPGFTMEFELEFSWPKDVDSWYCNTFGSSYDFRVNVNVTGVAGALDVTVGDGSDGKVEISTIDDFQLDVDHVSFDSGFLTSITNLGLSVADLFGPTCSSLTACVNDALDDNLTSRTSIKNALKDAINDAIADAATLKGAVNFGVATLDYTVALTSVSTNDSKDRLNTSWDVDFTSNTADASCASGLSKARYLPTSDSQTTSDLDVQIPFKKISDLFYTVAKQGDFCAPFTWSSGGSSTTVDVKPAGSFRITTLGGSALSLSLPIKVEAALSANATSAITGTLAITGSLEPVCGGGLHLVPTAVNLQSLTGTMSYRLPNGSTLTMSATSFINSKKAAAETAILNAISPGLTVVPESFGLAGAGKYVSIGQVLYDTTSITVGLNLLDQDPYCD